MISIVVTCSEKTGHLREVSLTVEDEEGIMVIGKDSLVMITQAIDVGRRNKGDEISVARREYNNFIKVKSKKKESKASKEQFLGFCFSIVGATMVLYLMLAVLFG